VATVYVDLANTFEALHRIEEAIAAQRRAVEIWSRPPENPDLCYAQQGLANSLMLHSDFDEAWPIAQQALARFESTYGPNHFDTSYAQELLGELVFRRGHPREAEEHFRRVFEIRRKGSGDPLEVAESLYRVAEVQEHRGQLDGALATLDEVLKLGHIEPDAQHKEGAPSLNAAQQRLLLSALELRSTIRLAQHRRDDALADARQVLALAPALTSPSDRARTEAELQLRIAQLTNGDPQPAMLAFERALQERSPRDPSLPVELLELADAHLKASDPARAAQLVERAMALPALTQGAAEDRARAHFLLARAYAAQPARASELARQAQALYAKVEPGVATEDRRALARFIASGH
jgi:tetratricopeptide (TPR) repeat protein